MKRVGLPIVVFSVFSLLVMASSLARAQVFLDIYGGTVQPADQNLKVKTGTARDSESVSYKPSFTLGGRVGAWGEATGVSWFGMAIDTSYFRQKADDSVAGTKWDINVFPVTLLLLFRYPGDTFRPYVGVGGGLFISYVDENIDLSAVGGPSNGDFKDTEFDVGFDGRAGLNVLVSKHVALFAEGRFTYFRPSYDDKISGSTTRVSTESEVYHLLAGISYNF